MSQDKKNNFFYKIRIERNLTLKQVAALAGIKYQQYQKFESGERELSNASFITTCKILEALDIDIKEYYQSLKDKDK